MTITLVRLRPVRFAAMVVVVLCGASCEAWISDSATRIAYAVRDGAERLRRSSSTTLVLSVEWRSSPDGCPAGYRVDWKADDKDAGLGVTCATGARSFSTTYYRPFVKVPATLQTAHEKGESTTVALRKTSNGTIEVIALR